MTGTAARRARTARRGAAAPVLVGAVCGLAWAAALRGLMAQFAGRESVVDWLGTFEGILLPGALVGGLLGWAEHLRRTGGRPGWLVAAPLVFVLATPEVVVSVFVDGLGGGALAVPLFGMAGGWALSGRGPRWARWVAGAFALLAVPGWLITASFVGGDLALGTPRGAWIAVLFLSLLAVLSLACAVPLRSGAARPRPEWRLVVAGAVCGIAWGAGLRAFMAAAAGPDTTVSWIGTFGVILPASAVVGALLGRAAHRWRTSVPPGRRLVLAPLVFAIDPFALAVVLPAMAGGYALSGRASRRARWAGGACALVPVPLYLLLVTFLDDVHTLATPRGAWQAVLLFSLLAVLTLACVIPHRALMPAVDATGVDSAAGPSGDAGTPRARTGNG